MLSAPLVLLLELPPLAFGAGPPLAASAPPWELTCDVHDLGRPRLPHEASPYWVPNPVVDLGRLTPTRERYLVNPLVDAMLVLGGMARTKGGWEERPRSVQHWEASGAVTPVPLPPLAPPAATLRP